MMRQRPHAVRRQPAGRRAMWQQLRQPAPRPTERPPVSCPIPTIGSVRCAARMARRCWACWRCVLAARTCRWTEDEAGRSRGAAGPGRGRDRRPPRAGRRLCHPAEHPARPGAHPGMAQRRALCPAAARAASPVERNAAGRTPTAMLAQNDLAAMGQGCAQPLLGRAETDREPACWSCRLVRRALKANDGNLTKALRAVLQEAIERQRPPGERKTDRVRNGWCTISWTMRFVQGSACSISRDGWP